jgi:hypothetical protein
MSQHLEDQIKMPVTLEDVTSEWLSQALSCRFPGTRVTSLHFGSIVHGSSTKVRLLLNYNVDGHAYRLPPTVWMKTGFEKHSGQISDSNRSEVLFYRHRAPEGLTNHAKCYFAGSNADTQRSVMLLEDLLARNARFGFATEPTTPATAREVIDMMARYHARWWNSPDLAKLGPLGGSLIADDWISIHMAEDNFAQTMALPRAAFVPAHWQDRDLMAKALYGLWELNSAQPPYCLLHGDMHLGNCFFEPGGKPGLLDWSGTMWGPWAVDFSEFLLTSLEVPVRRAHDRDLLAYYLEQLRSYGVQDPPSFEEAWLSYRRNALWGFSAATCPLALQPEEVCSPYTERYMAAITDLGSLDSLDN